MRLEHNLNAEHANKENRETPESKKLSKFKDFIEKNAGYLKNAVKYSLIAASLVFTVKCGSPGNNEKDGDTDVENDSRIDNIDDTYDDDLLDTIEEGDVPLDETEVDIVDEDVVEEELPAPVCDAPVENICPATNADFEAVVTDTSAVIDAVGTADIESIYSLEPTGAYEICPSGDGGYELVCVDDSRDFNEQYCYSADNIDVIAEPASSETDICPPPEVEYPIIAGAPETMGSVVYDFGGGLTIDSIAGFTFEDVGAYFNVHNSGTDTAYTVATLSFAPTSAGTYAITNMMDAFVAAMSIRSVDGRGSESVTEFDTSLSGGSSKPFYLVAVASDGRANYDVDVQARYGWGTALTTCFRCSGSGGNHYDLVIPLGDVICASDDDATACGCLGLPTNITIENITILDTEPMHLRDRVTVGTPILDISVVDSGTAVPSVTIPYDYVRGSIWDDLISSTIFFDIVLDGVGHVCSGATPFHRVYEVEVYAADPDGPHYSTTCSCTFEG